MSVDTTVSRLAERNATQARILAEVAAIRASGMSRKVYEQITAEHPEDAQQIAYALSQRGGAQ